MRYIKVFLLAILFFLALVFFFQNQGALSQSMVLTLNLFFIPAMSSIALPFYFLVIAAFAFGLMPFDVDLGSSAPMRPAWQGRALGRVARRWPLRPGRSGAWGRRSLSAWLTGEVLDLNGGAHLKRYPNIHQHLTKLMGQ